MEREDDPRWPGRATEGEKYVADDNNEETYNLEESLRLREELCQEFGADRNTPIEDLLTQAVYSQLTLEQLLNTPPRIVMPRQNGFAIEQAAQELANKHNTPVAVCNRRGRLLHYCEPE
jgi:hypothetical protein